MNTSYEATGLNVTDYENSSNYLAELTSVAAVEIDNYLLERNDDFSSVERFAGILQKCQLDDSNNAINRHNFPYLTLWKAMKKDSPKEIRYVSELALEMKLFQSEISNIKNLPKRELENLRDFCVQASREFQVEASPYLRRVA